MAHLIPGHHKPTSQPVSQNAPNSVVRGTCVTNTRHKPVPVSRTGPEGHSKQLCARFCDVTQGCCFVDWPIETHIPGSLKIDRPSTIVSSVIEFYARSTQRARVWRRAPRPSLLEPTYTRPRSLLAHPLTLLSAPAARTHPAMSCWHDAHDQLAVSHSAAAVYTCTNAVLGSYRSPSATHPASFCPVRVSYGDCSARAMRMNDMRPCGRVPLYRRGGS